MSFSSQVKDEMCRSAINRRCCALAECYGVFLYCNTFSETEIKIITENHAFAARLPKLMKKAFGFEPDCVPEEEHKGKLIISVTDREKCHQVLESYGYSWGDTLSLHINLATLEDECCRQSFVRGAFLAGGSVTDPEKRYHLELSTTHRSVSRELYSLLLEMGFEPKETGRGACRVTYFKQSDYIEDLLTLMGAPVGSMKIMSTKLEKELINDVNRRVNCETANITKLVEASGQQLEAIEKIEAEQGLDSLPTKLRQAAILRRDNPEASLAELGSLCDPPISKSAFNHRLQRIISIAGDIE